jgi:hypothetical protein
MTRTVLAMILVAVSVAVLASNTVGGTIADTAARILFGVLCLCGLRTGTIRELLLLTFALILTALLLRTPDGRSILPEAIDLAAYFAAFIALLTALKIAAERSRSVLSVGKYLIRQPPGRRFLATASGGHILGIFLNFGAVSLMAPLIQNATKHPDGTIDQDLERRQMSALLRGFAWILLWAPTTLTQAVLLTLFTSVDLTKIIFVGIATSVLMVAIGFIYDRFEWRDLPLTRYDDPVPTFPRTSMIRLGVICTTLIGATAALQLSLGYTTALSLMFVAPAVTLVWYGLQASEKITLPAQVASFWSALEANAAGLARSAIALGLSGFIGRSLAEVLPMATLMRNLDLADVPGWLFLAALPLLITLGGQIALSPIILVVFIGQGVQTLPILPADPSNIVFALSAGWAISMLASPNATATLLISATSKIPPTTLTWRWNLRYAAICYVVLVGIFGLLEA